MKATVPKSKNVTDPNALPKNPGEDYTSLPYEEVKNSEEPENRYPKNQMPEVYQRRSVK